MKPYSLVLFNFTKLNTLRLFRDFSNDTEAAQFMEYYNEARYSDKDIPEDAVSCARNMLKKKI